MTKRRWFLAVWVVGLVVTPGVACSTDQQPLNTSARQPTLMPSPNATPTILPATFVVPSVAAATASPIPTFTVATVGWALTDVQFALDTDQTGELIFPATEFPFGVTRIYVRFTYEEMGDVRQVESRWTLNGNPVSPSALAWDGGAEGDYVIWMEDPEGLGRGQWRWELTAGADVLGGGAFTISGQPGYVNETWRVSFEPPPTWERTSEQENFVTFSSADQRHALALTATPGAAELPEIVAAQLALFRADHPDAKVVATTETTMNGRPALLQRVRYVDTGSGVQEPSTPENVEQLLFIVSAINAGSGYSLWVLGPADEEMELEERTATVRLSVRFLTGE